MDAWRDGPSMSAPRCGLGFVSDGARLFAIGGYDEEEFVSFFFQLPIEFKSTHSGHPVIVSKSSIRR